MDDSKDDEGWMRDYVVTTKQKISATTPSDTAEESTAGGEGDGGFDRDERESGSDRDGEDEPRGQSAPNDGRQGACAAQRGTKVNIYEQTMDKRATSEHIRRRRRTAKVGYLRDYVVTLDKGASTTGSSASTAAAAEDLQDREVIGKATTNRAANVREEPLANATVVRQLGNGMELQILAKYAGVKEETWYEVVTASGKTHGFVRDYVVCDEAR